MHGSRWISGSLLASKFIWARLRSGTEAGIIFQDALSCKQQHKLLTPMHGCGAEMVSLRFRASACSVIPIGNPAFVRSELRKKTVLHSVLLDRFPVVQDLQSAWLLLLYCANTQGQLLGPWCPAGGCCTVRV